MTFPNRLPDPDADGNQPDYFELDDPQEGMGAFSLIAAVVIVSVVAFAGLWLDGHPGVLALFGGSR